MEIKLRKVVFCKRLPTQVLAECLWICGSREFHSPLCALPGVPQGILRSGLMKPAHNERKKKMPPDLKIQWAFDQPQTRIAFKASDCI